MAEPTAISSLEDAISRAAANMDSETGEAPVSDGGGTVDKNQPAAPAEKQEPEPVVTAPAADPVEDFLKSKGLSKEAFDNAVNLYQAVNDEKRAGGVIKYLQENWEQHQGRKAAAEPTIVDLVKAELGEGFGEFAEKIAPAIEKIVERKIRPVNARFSQQDQAAATQTNLQITQEFAKEFIGEDNLPDHIADEMTRLVAILPPSGKIPVKDYIRSIGQMALQNLNIAPKPKPSSTPRPAAPPSPISRLTRSAAKPSEGVSAAPKDISLDEAIKMADANISGKS